MNQIRRCMACKCLGFDTFDIQKTLGLDTSNIKKNTHLGFTHPTSQKTFFKNGIRNVLFWSDRSQSMCSDDLTPWTKQCKPSSFISHPHYKLSQSLPKIIIKAYNRINLVCQLPIFRYKLPDWSALEICYHNSMLAVQIYSQLLGFSLILSLLKVIYTVLCFCNNIIMQVSIWPVTIPPPLDWLPDTNFFPSKFLPRGQLYGAKLQPPGRKNETKPPPLGIISLLKCKISIKMNIIL